MNSRRNHFPSGFGKPGIMLLGMVCVAMLFAACGKKGPLYLPDRSDAPDKTVEKTVNSAPAQPGTK